MAAELQDVQIYPNFNTGFLVLSFSLSDPAQVQVEIIGLAKKENPIFDQALDAGEHRIQYDLTQWNLEGQQVLIHVKVLDGSSVFLPLFIIE